ncbi:hypothetical protein DAEQUDRAFT_601255 [Daedalea quercina L-15889]|uniref:Uncharacterized protein n=1 Tax=Daedalea quercina L-15889 TaxID=1314783 RepID=A0A165LMG6_9APHY|nr:hypothetical protein DAEQUDRAFT_601255 [Daedalea quercina L-15889]
MERLPPVFLLPPELLSECFLSCAMTIPSRPFGLDPEPQYSWISLSHVCRHWRSVALSTTRLWARIRLTSHREWTSEVVVRSGEAPLEVSAEFPLIYDNLQSRVDWMASFRVVLEEIARIRSLIISSQQKLEPEVLDLLNRPAPLLKDLRLHYLAFDAPNAAYEGAPHALGFMSRDRDIAPLESLSLYKCHIPWFGLDMQTLKDLTIVGLPWGGVSRSLNMQTLVQILRSTPLLERLVIRNALRPLSAISAPPTGPPAVLPRLRDVKLYGCSADVIRLLDHLQLVAISQLYMSLVTPLVDPPDRFAASVVRKLLVSGELSRLHIKGEGYHLFSLDGHVTRSPVHGPVSSPEIHVFHVTVSSTQCRRILGAFIQHPSLNCVRTLHITSLCRRRIWVTIGEHCRNVSELVVQGKRATKILYRMLNKSSEDTSNDERVPVSPPLPFPHLRSLSLGNLREQGFSPGDASHAYVQFWRDRLDDRCGADGNLSVAVQQMVIHECVPNALRRLDIALIPKTEAGHT